MSRDRGSATIWVLACISLLALVTVAATMRSAAILARHRAESAADLAALAAATGLGRTADPCSLAYTVAALNGAEVSNCTVEAAEAAQAGSVRVWVTRELHLPILGTRQVTARARAARVAPT
ncbi:MAG TPA: Rv3654c family TadE-like protein [Jatrophihabitans sp.]|jgi:secretion/DNA translocation related TadE-like protein